MCPACLCGGEAAGHNAMRGSGPNQKYAFKDALTQTGSPDPRNDRVCITSSRPRQFLQNFKRRRRCLASPPCRSRFTQPPYSTLDAAEAAPSTASKTDFPFCLPHSGLQTTCVSYLFRAAPSGRGGTTTKFLSAKNKTEFTPYFKHLDGFCPRCVRSR